MAGVEWGWEASGCGPWGRGAGPDLEWQGIEWGRTHSGGRGGRAGPDPKWQQGCRCSGARSEAIGGDSRARQGVAGGRVEQGWPQSGGGGGGGGAGLDPEQRREWGVEWSQIHSSMEEGGMGLDPE